MNNRIAALLIVAAAAPVLLAGCQSRTSAFDLGGPPEPLPSAPLEPVQTGNLDPMNPADPSMQQPQGDQVASLDPLQQQPTASIQPPPSSGAPVTREEMAGTWVVGSDNPECRIILAFTKWSGGYRAATRRCVQPEMGSVTAWDVRDNQVVLVDGGGNTVATLYSAGNESYSGSTSNGKPVRFTR
jgi:hypothetical protein